MVGLLVVWSADNLVELMVVSQAARMAVSLVGLMVAELVDELGVQKVNM